MTILRKTTAGFEVFDEVPDNFILATMTDFEKGRFVHQWPYIVKRADTDVYDTYRVNVMVPARIVDFIKENRVFIYVKPN